MIIRQLMYLLEQSAEAIAKGNDDFAREFISYFFETLASAAMKERTTATFNAGEHILNIAKKIIDDRLERGRW